MSKPWRFHKCNSGSVVLTSNMPNGNVTLVTCVTGRVILVTRVNYWHVVLRQERGYFNDNIVGIEVAEQDEEITSDLTVTGLEDMWENFLPQQHPWCQ